MEKLPVEAPSPTLWNRLFALLIIGRVSNLPTVWANCLAAKALSLGPLFAYELTPFFGPRDALLWTAASLVYLCGTWLNDVADIDFDAAHRPGRPIPAGLLSRAVVAVAGSAAGLSGLALLLHLGASLPLSLGLLAAVLLYTALHKKWVGGPWLMGSCRLLLVTVASSVFYPLRDPAGQIPVFAWAWGAAVGLHIVGLSALARREATGGLVPAWSRMLLFTPATLALGQAWLNLLSTSAPNYLTAVAPGIGLSVAAAFWTLRSLAHLRAPHPARIARCVSSLLAGLALYDAAIAAPSHLGMALLGLACFAFARLSQQFLPAT